MNRRGGQIPYHYSTNDWNTYDLVFSSPERGGRGRKKEAKKNSKPFRSVGVWSGQKPCFDVLRDLGGNTVIVVKFPQKPRRGWGCTALDL